MNNNTTTKVQNAIIFVFFGLSIAFPLGLLMLTVGPTRMIAEKAAAENWTNSMESTIQKIAIVLFIFVVVLLTFFINRLFNSSRIKKSKIVLLLLAGFALFSSLYIFSFKPEILVVSVTSVEEIDKNSTTEFHFGAYPDIDKIEQLKKENYTAIISLLSPLVVPAEPILMEKEKVNTTDAGMKLISVPMLPWLDDNEKSLLQIKKLAQELKGKYYVHCYLGKDRANVFRNIIQNENSKLTIKSSLGSNDINALTSFERGKIIKLQPQIYFTPFPTDDEFFGFILTGKIKNVVSIMDSKTNPVQFEKEKKIMLQYNQNYFSLPLSERSSENEIKEIVQKILKLQQPILVNSYFTNTPLSNKFVKIFKATKLATIQ